MSALIGIVGLWGLLRRLLLEPIAAVGRWAQSYLTPNTELLVVAITVPILVDLAAWLASAQGASPTWSLAVATILGLVAVSPFMLNAMLSYTPIEIDETPFTAPISLVKGAPKSSETQD